MDEAEAITAALEAYKLPQAFRLSSRLPLPQGMLTLIKLAAATPEEARALVSDETADQLPVQQAASFYLQHILIHADSDVRQLALNEGATLQEVKEHKRWLLKWLHPDRNPNSWESALFQRVSTASARLEATLREGGIPPSHPARERRTRTRRSGSWQIAQRRVAKAVGWRSRVIKLALATILLVLLVAAAQIGLTMMQGAPGSWALSFNKLVAKPVSIAMREVSQ